MVGNAGDFEDFLFSSKNLASWSHPVSKLLIPIDGMQKFAIHLNYFSLQEKLVCIQLSTRRSYYQKKHWHTCWVNIWRIRKPPMISQNVWRMMAFLISVRFMNLVAHWSAEVWLKSIVLVRQGLYAASPHWALFRWRVGYLNCGFAVYRARIVISKTQGSIQSAQDLAIFDRPRLLSAIYKRIGRLAGVFFVRCPCPGNILCENPEWALQRAFCGAGTRNEQFAFLSV